MFPRNQLLNYVFSTPRAKSLQEFNFIYLNSWIHQSHLYNLEYHRIFLGNLYKRLYKWIKLENDWNCLTQCTMAVTLWILFFVHWKHLWFCSQTEWSCKLNSWIRQFHHCSHFFHHNGFCWVDNFRRCIENHNLKNLF